MAKKKEEIEVKGEVLEVQSEKKPKVQLKRFKLKDDYPPKKKGEFVQLSKEGETYLKSKNLI